MINQADQVLIIWDGVSKGTQYSIQYAKKMQKKIMVLRSNGTLWEEYL